MWTTGLFGPGGGGQIGTSTSRGWLRLDGDRWRGRRAFAIGIAVYGAGSATTAMAPKVGILVTRWSVLEGAGAGVAVGPLLGGWVTTVSTWRWVFAGEVCSSR